MPRRMSRLTAAVAVAFLARDAATIDEATRRSRVRVTGGRGWTSRGSVEAAPPVSLALHKHRHVPTTPRLFTPSTTPLRGDNMDDYSTPVYIDGQGPFALNVDTGSALLGVAGNESIGCDEYFDASACAGPDIKVTYGSGFWAGIVCEATVSLGNYNVTNYRFGAYTSQEAMTTCERTPPDDPTSPLHMTRPTAYMQGIIGLSFSQGTTAGSPPFLERLFAERPNVTPFFGLQCCGFGNGVGGGGALDVGGLDRRRFYGAIRWVPVVQRKYWAVRATSIAFGDVEVLPADVAAVATYPDGAAQTIVDSGTSGLVLPTRAFRAAVAALSAAAPGLPGGFWRGDVCVPVSALDVASLPPLVVALAADDADVVLSMPACRYVARVPATSYCAAAAPPRGEDSYLFSVGEIPEGRNVILGQAAFESFYVAHDMSASSPRVGFAPIRGCDDDGCAPAEALRPTAATGRWLVVAALLLVPSAAYVLWRRGRRRDGYVLAEVESGA